MSFNKAKFAAVIVFGGLLLSACNKATTSSITAGPTSTKPAGEETIKNAAVITYNGSSFSPSTLNVSKEQKIIIKNDSSANLGFYSGPHPTHQDNPELNLGTIEAGQLKTLLLTKPGTYYYHNHLSASQEGTIVVK